MTGISTNGAGLPSAQSLFANTAPTTAPVAAPTPSMTVSNVPSSGLTVSGPGGTTVLPPASPADFQGVNPTPLDQPHEQYLTLIKSHVAVLQAIGTPEHVIARLAETQPTAEFMEQYIQGDIMQNPEGWDAFVGNPAGTARAGLQKLMPNVQLPPVGAGGTQPATLQTPMIGGAPATTQPLGAPEKSDTEKIIKGVVIAAAVIGVGLLGWHLWKKRNAAAESGVRALVSGEAKGGPEHLLGLIDDAAGGGNKLLGRFNTPTGKTAENLLMLKAIAGGPIDPAGATASAAMHGVLNNLGPVDGWLHQIGSTAAAHNQDFGMLARLSLQKGAQDIAMAAVRTGQIGDLATSGALLGNLAAQGVAQAGQGQKLAQAQQYAALLAQALA